MMRLRAAFPSCLTVFGFDLILYLYMALVVFIVYRLQYSTFTLMKPASAPILAVVQEGVLLRHLYIVEWHPLYPYQLAKLRICPRPRTRQ